MRMLQTISRIIALIFALVGATLILLVGVSIIGYVSLQIGLGVLNLLRLMAVFA